MLLNCKDPQDPQDLQDHQELPSQALQDLEVQQGKAYQDLLDLLEVSLQTQKPSSLVPLAHLGPLAPREIKVLLDHEDTKGTQAFQDSLSQVQTLWELLYKAHLAHLVFREFQGLRVTKATLVSQVLLESPEAPLEEDHQVLGDSQAPLVPLAPPVPSAAPDGRFSSTSLITYKVTASEVTCREFRVPLVLQGLQDLSPPLVGKLLITLSWQVES